MSLLISCDQNLNLITYFRSSRPPLFEPTLLGTSSTTITAYLVPIYLIYLILHICLSDHTVDLYYDFIRYV